MTANSATWITTTTRTTTRCSACTRPATRCTSRGTRASAKRCWPARSLTEAGPREAALVERALNDLAGGDWILQWEAVHDLTERRAEQAAPKLEALLNSKNEAWLRARALIALAGIRKETALAKALEFSTDENPALR